MKRIKIVLMKVDDDVSETEIAPLLTVRGRENLIKMRNLEMLEILGKVELKIVAGFYARLHLLFLNVPLYFRYQVLC